jgi:hypothetical protein
MKGKIVIDENREIEFIDIIENKPIVKWGNYTAGITIPNRFKGQKATILIHQQPPLNKTTNKYNKQNNLTKP